MAEKQGTHFYAIAIMYQHGRGHATIGSRGTWTPGRKQTRFDVCNEIFDQMVADCPEAAGGLVVTFELQRNRI